MSENEEICHRFDELEKRMDSIHSINSSELLRFSNSRSDEIDLVELWKIIWQGKWWIIAITFMFSVAGVFYAKSLPNIYKSEGVYAPSKQRGGAGSSVGQLGGLAAMAGISLGEDGVSQVDMALKRVNSWPFLELFINENELKPELFAVDHWDNVESKIVWDKEIYDPDSKSWTRVVEPPFTPEPSSFESYERLLAYIEINRDKKSGLITIGVEHRSPVIAHDILVKLVKTLNNDFKLRDLSKAKENIAYLQSKIAETGIAGMQAIFYGMIEEQLKSMMLAEVADDYLFEMVVEPKVAEFKVGPSRALICVVAMILGGILSSIGILIVGLLRERK